MMDKKPTLKKLLKVHHYNNAMYIIKYNITLNNNNTIYIIKYNITVNNNTIN